MSFSDDEVNIVGSALSSNMEGEPTMNTAVLIAASASASDTETNVFVGKSSFEDRFLRCQICLNKFDQAKRSPKLLPCNHTFCLPCLTHIFDLAVRTSRSPSATSAVKCPTCRTETFLSSVKIKKLPTDHRVVQLMDFFCQAMTKSRNVCPKHGGQPLSFFCKNCSTPVCRDCTVLDHNKSDGHQIVDMSEALNENSAQFNDIEQKSRETLEGINFRSDCLTNALNRLDILEHRLENDIKETFIEYRLHLEKREEALTSVLHQIVKEQKDKVSAKFAYVREHGAQLQKLYDEFNAGRNSNDYRKRFASNQQMKEHESRFTQIAAQDDSDLFQSCEFKAQNEESFLSGMSSLGEVRTKPDPELRKSISADQLKAFGILKVEEPLEHLVDNVFDNSNSFPIEYSSDIDDAESGHQTDTDFNRYRLRYN